MAIETNKLSARFCETAPAGRHGDGGGLYLVVSKTGSKSWLFIYRFGTKQREAGFGSLSKVSLKAARIAASEARELLGRGIDPLDHRAEQVRQAAAAAEAVAAQEAKATFGTFALELLNGYVVTDEKGRNKRVPGLKEGFRNEKHQAQWETTLKTYCKPIWSMKLDEIGIDDVFKCLSPIWTTKQETASRLRGRIEAVLTAAIARKLRPAPNPATWQGNLEALLPRRQKLARGHHAALDFNAVPAFWKKLNELFSVSSEALKFTILTAARSGETRGATWAEFDLVNAVWTIPAARMKAGRLHQVPLSSAALAVIEAVQPLRMTDDPHEQVFPSVRDRKPLSDMAILQCLKGLDPSLTVHGFRSSFRDWAGDATTFPRELAEAALAHTVGGVEGAYRRSSALEKRRVMMEAGLFSSHNFRSDFCFAS